MCVHPRVGRKNCVPKININDHQINANFKSNIVNPLIQVLKLSEVNSNLIMITII